MIENQNSNLESSYTIQEILFLLKKHIKIILAIFFATILLIVIYTFSSDYIYKSSSTIIVNKDPNSLSILNMGYSGERNFIDNEIGILRSRTTSEKVIKRLLDSDNIDLHLFGKKNNNKSFFNSTDNNNDFQTLSKEDFVNKYANKLKKSVYISNNKRTDAINISIESKDPEEAAMLVNTLIDVYRERDLEWATGEMSHLKTFLLNQLSKKQKELNEIENLLKSFQEKEKIFTIDDNSKIILDNLTLFETEYNNVLASIDIINEKEKFITGQLNSDEKLLAKKVSNTINQRLQAFKVEMAVIESELISTQTKYGNNHSAVLELENKLENVKSKIEDETRNLINEGITVADPILYRQTLMDSVISIKAVKANLLSKAKAYQNLVDDYDNKLSMLPEKILEYTRLERDRAIHAETYRFMSQKLEEARIGEASKLSKIRIVDKAIANKIPIKPNKSQNIIFGIILGIVLGIGASMVMEFFDNTIKSIEQIERRGLAILSMIPAISSKNNRNKNSKRYVKNDGQVEQLQRRLITHEDPKSPISEAYRSLRTSLMYTKSNSESNVILVSSPGPGEGKTTTIANLAITYANLGKKTLLIDSDLRKPVIHNVFKADKSPGLTSFLSGNSDLKSILNKTDIDNLEIITSGVIPPNPSELLDSNKMIDFIEKVKNQFDVILFDSPPLVAVTDAFVLMKYIDQFILVVRPGKTERGALERVIASTQQSNMNITGVVMNAMSEEHSYGSGYYYNYYQYYYGDKT